MVLPDTDLLLYPHNIRAAYDAEALRWGEDRLQAGKAPVSPGFVKQAQLVLPSG
jgi:hypothetical protein